LRAFTHTI
jgi:hypothetical protein